MAELRDTVKNTVSDTVGVIFAIYEKDGVDYFDVRVDERIYYETPAANWVVVIAADE